MIAGDGRVEVRGTATIGHFPSPLYLSTYSYLEARHSSAEIIIGDGARINNNFFAVADYLGIYIGEKCLIGTGVEIYDSDFHDISLSGRSTSSPEGASAVHVGDGVFIGSNVKIMKGVTIGHGSVIGNGSIVTSNIPANVVAAGNPCRIIRSID